MTSRDILDELASQGGDGCYATLRQALTGSFPRLGHGRLPTARQLSMKLAALRGRRVDGAYLERGRHGYKGWQWRVRRQTEVA